MDDWAVGDPQPVLHNWDRAKTRILESNTAQGVHKHLRTLESNRSRVLPRWIWELLQNARDVSDGNASLVASVELRDSELTFCHNGRGFEPDEDHASCLLRLDETRTRRPDWPVRKRIPDHAPAIPHHRGVWATDRRSNVRLQARPKWRLRGRPAAPHGSLIRGLQGIAGACD